MPIFVEMVSPERTVVAVCLMIPFAVYTLEGIGQGSLFFVLSLGRLCYNHKILE